MKLKEKLSAAGHVATLKQVETAEPVWLNAKTAKLATMPAIDTYDALVFANTDSSCTGKSLGFLERKEIK